MVKRNSKIGAMEMSVGTIVTIVLLVSVLILGIILVQKIFKGSSDAIDSINAELNSQIQQLFSDKSQKLVVYPPSRDISLKKSDETPKGFGFSVQNTRDVESANFTYIVESSDVSQCGSTFTKDKANNFIIGKEGNFEIGPGGILEYARLVRFNIPESAPPCTMIYNLKVYKEQIPYSSADILVTIK